MVVLLPCSFLFSTSLLLGVCVHWPFLHLSYYRASGGLVCGKSIKLKTVNISVRKVLLFRENVFAVEAVQRLHQKSIHAFSQRDVVTRQKRGGGGREEGWKGGEKRFLTPPRE